MPPFTLRSRRPCSPTRPRRGRRRRRRARPLARAAQRGLLAELGQRVGLLPAGGLQRGPERAGGDDVDPDALRGELLGQRLADRVDRGLGGGVVHQPGGGGVGLDRAGGDDGRAGRQVRHGLLHDPEHRVDVGLEGGVELLAGQVGEVVDPHLLAGDQHDRVEAAELGDRGAHELAGPRSRPTGRPGRGRPLAGVADELRDGLGVGLLLGQVVQDDVGALRGRRRSRRRGRCPSRRR